MFGLVYKDIITRKKQLLILLPVSVLFTFMVISNAVSHDEYIGVMLMLAAVCIILVSGMIEESSFENDERKKWISFISSAENGIRKQIGSKYLFNLLLMITVYTYIDVLFQFAEAIAGINVAPFYMALQLMMYLQVIYRAIESPFIVAFGSKYGNTIRMVVLLLLVFGFIVYGLFGDMSIFGSKEDLLLRAEPFLTDNGSYFILFTPACALILYFI